MMNTGLTNAIRVVARRDDPATATGLTLNGTLLNPDLRPATPLSWPQVRLMIQLGVTLPPELRAEAHPITAGSLVLMTLVLFGCLLISFGVGAPTGVSPEPAVRRATVPIHTSHRDG